MKMSTMAAAMDYVTNYNQPDVVVEVMCSGDGGDRCEGGNKCWTIRRRPASEVVIWLIWGIIVVFST